MTPADEIRQAAQTIRDALKVALWDGDRLDISPDAGGDLTLWVTREGRDPEVLISGYENRRLWPLIANLVAAGEWADLLEYEATTVPDDVPDDSLAPLIAPALAVARAINGSQP